jgi:excisionase family DNA binding protein
VSDRRPKRANDPKPRWASLAEVHERDQIPVKTLRRWISQGTLPAYRVGPRQLQVDLNDVDRLRRRVPAATPRTPRLPRVTPDGAASEILEEIRQLRADLEATSAALLAAVRELANR